MTTDELDDDRLLGPDQPDSPVQQVATESIVRPAQSQTMVTVNREPTSNNMGVSTVRLS